MRSHANQRWGTQAVEAQVAARAEKLAGPGRSKSVIAGLEGGGVEAEDEEEEVLDGGCTTEELSAGLTSSGSPLAPPLTTPIASLTAPSSAHTQLTLKLTTHNTKTNNPVPTTAPLLTPRPPPLAPSPEPNPSSASAPAPALAQTFSFDPSAGSDRLAWLSGRSETRWYDSSFVIRSTAGGEEFRWKEEGESEWREEGSFGALGATARRWGDRRGGLRGRKRLRRGPEKRRYCAASLPPQGQIQPSSRCPTSDPPVVVDIGMQIHALC